MSINSKMTAIADEIRELSGTTGTMGLDDMASNLKQVKPEVSIDSSNGLVTATVGTKSSTHQLAFQPAKTITPTVANQTAVSSGYYTGGNVMVAGDSNLVAGNIKSGVSIFGVNGTYAGSGDTSAEDSIVTRTISTYTNDRVSTIGSFAFAYCSKLRTVSFPAVSTIGGSAFAYCSKLTTVSFPAVSTISGDAFYGCYSLTTVSFPTLLTIGDNAFAKCYSLTTVSFPAVSTIGNNAFANCSSLTTVSFPAVSTIGGSAFYGCYSLTTVSFPVAKTIGVSAFAYCSKLRTVSFPAVSTIGGSAFRNCSSLTTVSFPAVSTIGNNAFGSCYSLTTVSFPVAKTIGAYAFANCSRLTSVYITGSSLCKLSKSNAFTSTPIGGYSKTAGTYGSIYVPTSLLTSYKTATNWTYFSSRFVGI